MLSSFCVSTAPSVHSLLSIQSTTLSTTFQTNYVFSPEISWKSTKCDDYGTFAGSSNWRWQGDCQFGRISKIEDHSRIVGFCGEQVGQVATYGHDRCLLSATLEFHTWPGWFGIRVQ